jgi:hypothetical protein
MTVCRGRYKDDTKLVVCPHRDFCALVSNVKGLRYFDPMPLTEAGSCTKFVKKPHITRRAINLNDEIPKNRRVKGKPSRTFKQGELFNT